jgi:hypothetical protein
MISIRILKEPLELAPPGYFHLFRAPFFSNEFLQTYDYCNGEVSVQLGVETDETVSKISFISICTWHMARSALSSHRTVTHLEVRVPKKLYCIVRIQRAAGCLSLYISLAHHLGSQVQMPKKLLHCQDRESGRLPLSAHRAHHLGSRGRK